MRFVRINLFSILIGAGVGIISLILFTNSKINSSLNETPPVIQQPIKVSSVPSEEVNQEKDTTLVIPANVHEPGIYVQGEEKDFWNDANWEAYISKTLNDSQVLNKEKSRKAFERMQKTPEEFKRRLESLNKRIKHYEDLKRKQPNSSDIQTKLENLYILKSTLLVLENKIVVPLSVQQ